MNKLLILCFGTSADHRKTTANHNRQQYSQEMVHTTHHLLYVTCSLLAVSHQTRSNQLCPPDQPAPSWCFITQIRQRNETRLVFAASQHERTTWTETRFTKTSFRAWAFLDQALAKSNSLGRRKLHLLETSQPRLVIHINYIPDRNFLIWM